jgi:glutaredoxin
VFQKVMVNGDDTHDVFKFCRGVTLPGPADGQPGMAQKPGEAIKWNFGKYVIDSDGQVVLRLGPKETVKVLDTSEHLGKWAQLASAPPPTAADAAMSGSASVQIGGKGDFSAFDINVAGGELSLSSADGTSHTVSLGGCQAGAPKSARKGHDFVARLDLSDPGSLGAKKLVLSLDSEAELQKLNRAVEINSNAEMLAAAVAEPVVETSPAGAAASAAIGEALKAAPLVIFSKTTCGYSTKVKDLVAGMDLPVAAHIVEVNERDDADAVQDRLEEITGARTVPRIFAAGKFIGGCDDIVAAYESGAFEKTLRDAGAYGTEPAPEPAKEPEPEPATKVETESEPVADTDPEADVEPAAEPAAEPSAEPVAEPAAEPSAEPVAEPAAEPSVEPASEEQEPAVKVETESEPAADTDSVADSEPSAEPVAEPAAEAPAEPAPEEGKPEEGEPPMST